MDLAVRLGINNAVFCNTSIEFPETNQYIKLIEEFYGLNLEEVRPKKTFFELLELGLNPPSRRYRWCCEPLKLTPLTLFGKKNEYTHFLTGIRRDESTKRRNYTYLERDEEYFYRTPINPSIQVNPILYWNRNDIWKYIRKYSLPINPLYKKGFMRTGCWICPHRTNSDFNLLKKLHPELYELFITIFTSFLENKGILFNKREILNIWMKGLYQSNAEIVGKVEENGEYYSINLKNIQFINRLQNILPDSKYYIEEQIILIKKFSESNKLKIFLEKSLNCIGCGTCLSICDALKLNSSNQISIDHNKCNLCLRCTSSSKIRKACIARNYKSIIYELENNGKELEFIQTRICSNSRIGLIRTRKSYIDVISTFSKMKSRKINEKSQIFLEDSFTIIIRNLPRYTEILVHPKRLNLEQSFIKLRALLNASN